MAQKNNDYYIQKKLYTYSDGLSGRIVKQALQDNNGFMWFVTNNGLCRFDGKNFQVFTQQTHGLYSNNISHILNDNHHGIIIVYFNDKIRFTLRRNNVDVLDINTLKIKKLHNYYKNVPFKESDIAEVRDDVDGNVWFFLVPYLNISVGSYEMSKLWKLTPKEEFIKGETKLDKSIKFIKNGKELTPVIEPYNSLEIEDKLFFIFKNKTVTRHDPKPGYIPFIDKQKGYILQVFDSLMPHYYRLTLPATITEIKINDTAYPSFLFNAKTRYFTERMDYTGLVFEQNKKLFLYYNNKELLTVIDSTDTEEIRNINVLGVFRDNVGNYWASSNEGVLKITVKEKKFRQLFTHQQIPFGLNNSTRGICNYKNNILVAAYDFIGVKNKSAIDIFKSDYNFNFLENNNLLWLVARDLGTFDLVTKKKVINTPHQLGEFWTIFPLNNNQLLLGCANTIGVYDIKTNQIWAIDSGKFRQPKITYRFFIHNNNIIAVAANGIYIINKEGKIIDCYNKDQKEIDKRILVDNINDVYIDKNGLYWICTAFDALYSWNRKDGRLENFGIESGFLSMTHYRIEEDEFNNLWISTEFGLAKFNKKTKRAKVFTDKDGVSHNEFNRISSFKDKDGTLYFGGMNGVTYFDPKDFFDEERTQDYSFVVNRVNVYNSSTYLIDDETENYFKQKKIVMSDNIKNVTLQVLLLDLEDRKHSYAYQIEGLDKQWDYVNDGVIKLNNLPYGEYTLKIKAQCSNGLWNKTEINIPVFVPIPFYKSWWFIVIIIASVIALLVFYVKQRNKKLEKENRKLEVTVEVRTFELKKALAEQIALLQEVHHRVKNNLQFIAAMLKMQLNTIKDEGNQQILKETSRRINAMSLVHEMLYNKEKLEYVSSKEYLTELVAKLKELLNDSNKAIEFKLNIDDVKFNINDCVAIGMITSEIISNAIKHAFLNSVNPTITINLELDIINQLIIYTIFDNGVGNNSQITKTGLGLRLIDIFSRQLEAEYRIENNTGTFYQFKIPYNTHG